MGFALSQDGQTFGVTGTLKNKKKQPKFSNQEQAPEVLTTIRAPEQISRAPLQEMIEGWKRLVLLRNEPGEYGMMHLRTPPQISPGRFEPIWRRKINYFLERRIRS
uniref:Uncharacterized protein n=1 Tax=Micrurus corallinus TaxID=54390 RepID=A0A2D4ENC5_MICCO